MCQDRFLRLAIPWCWKLRKTLQKRKMTGQHLTLGNLEEHTWAYWVSNSHLHHSILFWSLRTFCSLPTSRTPHLLLMEDNPEPIWHCLSQWLLLDRRPENSKGKESASYSDQHTTIQWRDRNRITSPNTPIGRREEWETHRSHWSAGNTRIAMLRYQWAESTKDAYPGQELSHPLFSVILGTTLWGASPGPFLSLATSKDGVENALLTGWATSWQRLFQS